MEAIREMELEELQDMVEIPNYYEMFAQARRELNGDYIKKKYNLLIGEIIGFEERVDNSRRDIPPDREAEVNGVVAGNVHIAGDDRRADALVVHLYTAA